MSAKDSLNDVIKLGQAVERVVEDNELELKNFAVLPRLDYDGEGPAGQVHLLCVFDPDKATKPKMEIVKMEGQVEEAFDEEAEANLAKRADEARKKLLETLKDNPRGGFLGDGK